jgi:hypothetical protein
MLNIEKEMGMNLRVMSMNRVDKEIYKRSKMILRLSEL